MKPRVMRWRAGVGISDGEGFHGRIREEKGISSGFSGGGDKKEQYREF